MGDFLINLEKDDILSIYCIFEDTSINFHNINGFYAESFDESNNFIGSIEASKKNHIFDFSTKKGKIIVTNMLNNPINLYFSSIIYSKLDKSNFCKDIRAVFSGNLIPFYGTTSNSIFNENKTISIENQPNLCIWYSNLVSNDFIFHLKSNDNKSKLTIIKLNSYNEIFYSLNETSSINFFLNESFLIYYQSDYFSLI